MKVPIVRKQSLSQILILSDASQLQQTITVSSSGPPLGEAAGFSLSVGANRAGVLTAVQGNPPFNLKGFGSHVISCTQSVMECKGGGAKWSLGTFKALLVGLS